MFPDDPNENVHERRGSASPISDAIRRSMRNGAYSHQPLISLPTEPTRGSVLLNVTRGCGHSFFFQESSNLPPFEDNELDDPQLLSSAAAEIYRMRRARDRLMPEGLMGEPAWDMLLALYGEEPAKLPVTTICYGSGVPQTTALRWIGVLDNQGLVERTKHHKDGRIILLSLTSEGRLIVERCLKAMLRAARA